MNMNKKKQQEKEKQQEERQAMEKSIREYVSTLPDMLNYQLFCDLEIDGLGSDTMLWVENVVDVCIAFPEKEASDIIGCMINSIRRFFQKLFKRGKK